MNKLYEDKPASSTPSTEKTEVKEAAKTVLPEQNTSAPKDKEEESKGPDYKYLVLSIVLFILAYIAHVLGY